MTTALVQYKIWVVSDHAMVLKPKSAVVKVEELTDLNNMFDYITKIDILERSNPPIKTSSLDEILLGFKEYQEQLAETKTITDGQYRMMAKAIHGCKCIIEKVFKN